MPFAQIQPLTDSNYADAFLIQQSCHLHPWSESVFVDSLSKPYFAFQSINNEVVCGYYIGMEVAREATLMDIGVDACFRGKGIGLAMLEHFIAKCIELHCEEIWLEVRASNSVAIKLYQRNGFELIETRKDYYGTKKGREDGLIMRKLL